MNFKKALITGGNGNLGRLVAEQLEARGVEVVSFDLPGTDSDATAARSAIVLGDIRDTDLLRSTVATHRPDAIFHLASLLSGSTEADPDMGWVINATASFELLKLAKEFDCGPFLFASTLATYGSDLTEPMPNNEPQWPANLYGVTKVAVERLGVYFKQKHGLDFRCLRFPMVLSPFAPKTAVTAYPSHAIKAAIEEREFTFPVPAETGVPTLFLDDVVASMVTVMDVNRDALKEHAYNVHGYYFNVEMLTDWLGAKYPGFQFDHAPDETITNLLTNWPNELDDSLARRDWNWKPEYDFEMTLYKMIELFRGEK